MKPFNFLKLAAVKLVRSRRRTLALQVRPDGTLTVRAPIFMREDEIEGFVRQKSEWIEKTAARLQQKAVQFPPVILEKAEKKTLQEDVFMKLTKRCQVYAPRMGVRYQTIGLSGARARWGSCSPDGRLRFNWRLSLVPDAILDYVVVHELAHLKQANHSPRFWSLVEQFYPDVRQAKSWLKENQQRLTAYR